MADREEVVKGLTEISEYMSNKADIAGVGKGKEVFDSWYRAAEDARELLREQEPVATDTNVHGKWISVKDRLPELGEPYYAACRSLTDDRKPWVFEGTYGLVTHDKPWGMPFIALGKAEVFAWMPKVYPEPPKEEDG